MDRPSKEHVDQILVGHTPEACADVAYAAECYLAAEVRALRATIARVEALSAKWMDYVVFDTGGVPDCAKDLEEALKGQHEAKL